MDSGGENHVIHKQDIDDNCPMTGDETDTEQNTNLYDKHVDVLPLSDVEPEDQMDERNIEDFKTEQDGLKVEDVDFDNYVVQNIEDEEESFSSGRNYFSDEETSSVAGSFDDFGKDEAEDDSFSEPMTEKTREEKLGRLALRRHLDQLGDLVVEREYTVQQARDQLQKCDCYISKLENELLTVKQEIKEAETNDQTAIFYRLKSKYDKLVKELNIEKEVKQTCLQNLEDAEFSLAQTYIEHAKFLPINEELDTEDRILEKVKTEKATNRLKKEMASVAALERKKKLKDKEYISAVRERERRNRQSVIASKKNREMAMKYLKDTMSQVRQRESEEEDKSRNDLNKRMSALLSLKRNIELNKENIKAVQARNHHMKSKEGNKDIHNRVQLRDESADEVLTRRKRLRQYERDKEAFERKQREREIDIVNNTISEEKSTKSRYQQQPQLWPDNRPRRVPRRRSKPRFAPSSGSESMEYGADVEDTGGKISYLSKFSTDEEGEFSPYGATTRDDDDDREETTETEDEDKEIKEGNEDDEENFNEPEFKGLWEQDPNQIEKSEKNWKSNDKEYSLYEKEMMVKALNKQRKNIVQKQVAAGKEFKGCAFNSKPETIVFKDFTVGDTYKEKVVLTNVSYTQNHCQLIGVSDNLKDFVNVTFTPPGSMSAGLTCELFVNFTPMINEDLEGQIEMISQTGLFYISIKCLIKRCEVGISENEIVFENQVIGETRTKIILLKNIGALATDFVFNLIDDNSDAISEVFSLGGASTVGGNPKTPLSAIPNISVPPITEENTVATNDSVKDSIDTNKDQKEMYLNDGIIIGQVKRGTLAPFSTISLKIVFAPLKPICYESNFELTFSNETVQAIFVKAKGHAIDLPVWVEREVVDLKICMFDRLYQDAIIVSNRATYALRLRVEVPVELRNHVDMLPKTAYIQAESQFSIQLKFLPRKSLLEDAGTYFDKETGLLEVPITLRVADQTRPVMFTLKAIVTSSDFEFDIQEIDFGCCTIYEKVMKTIKLHNKSVLPQQYGFVATPPYIDVQPNDGFGSILPNEQLDIDLYFSPDKAKDFKFSLICKSHIGREFALKCKGIGVLPPLHLSDSLIKFRATAVEDVSNTHLFVINDHTSTNQFTHPVPRIGSKEIFPVGPTSFEFILPTDCPLLISPSVGTVMPGEKCMIHITFAPKLNPENIKQKMKQLKENDKEEILKKELEDKVEKVNDMVKVKGKPQKPNVKSKGNTPVSQSPAKTVAANQNKEIKEIDKNLQYEKRAQLDLQQSYANTFSSYKIPCYIAYGRCGAVELVSGHNTLYLEVHCPSVKPSLIVVSESGDNLVNFGKVSMGQRHVQTISIQNISNETLTLSSSIIDPLGPFEIVNTLRPIEPKAIESIQLSFTPQNRNEFYEVLDILSPYSSVKIRLKGQGIQPELSLEPSNETFDVGDALINDTLIAILKITNTSELSLMFDLSLGSLSPFRHNRTQTLPAHVEQYKEKADTSFLIGPGNLSGICVFGCSPSHGTLEPGETKEISILFSPDHPSELYRDELLINVNGAEEFMQVHLTGRAWSSILYAKGWERLTPCEESLLPCLYTQTNDEKTVLLSFHSPLKDGCFTTVEQQIELGCIKSAIQMKKSCDWSIENFKDANDEGFIIDAMKGGIDIGSKKYVTFKWTPTSDFDPEHPARGTVNLIMRGDVIITYTVLLRGYMRTKLVDE